MHAWQVAEPAVAAKVPVSQGVHVDAPAGEAAPAGQAVALLEPEGQLWPAGQGEHAAVPLANVPAGQVVAVYAQDVASAVLKAPATQAVGAQLPVAQEKPAGQLDSNTRLVMVRV